MTTYAKIAASMAEPDVSESGGRFWFVTPLLVWLLSIGLATLSIVELKAPDPVAATAPAGEFSSERALIHVRRIAQTPHPLGSEANGTVRSYLVEQLETLGFHPQVFRSIGVQNSPSGVAAGITQDVLGRLPGTSNSRAVMVVAHYDSVQAGPGAADDGSSVAAILETLRALRSGPPLKNDLIVLFTDGEELGLLGAEAFANSHPWMNDVGLVLNFEARGNRGPSLLFETSLNNERLIRGFAKSASHPVGSSLFYALYRLLPNDTDFTVFRAFGVAGMNFAYGEDLDAYHSRLDTPGNLSAASLQHQGSYVLDLTRTFGQSDLRRLTERGDAVFFDWLGDHLIAYRNAWILPGQILVTALLILTILVARRRARLRIGRAVFGLFSSLLILVAIPLLLAGTEMVLSRLLEGHAVSSDTPSSLRLFTGLALLGACAGCTLFSAFRRRAAILELSLSGLVIVCALSWVLAFFLPAGCYVLFWPLLVATIGVLGTIAIFRSPTPTAQIPAAAISAAAALLLFCPIAYLLYIFLTLQVITASLQGLFLGLLLILSVPLVDAAVPRTRVRFVVLPLFLASMACFIAGIAHSAHNAQHPGRDAILYSLDEDTHQAQWIGYVQFQDTWTRQFFADEHAASPVVPEYLADARTPMIAAPAPPVDLVPPSADISDEGSTGEVRRIRVSVTSGRGTDMVALTFDKGVQLLDVKIGNRDIAPKQSTGLAKLTLYGMGSQKVDLAITLKSSPHASFWLMDRSSGLPTPIRQRPGDLMPFNGSDVTLVGRKYSF